MICSDETGISCKKNKRNTPSEMAGYFLTKLDYKKVPKTS